MSDSHTKSQATSVLQYALKAARTRYVTSLQGHDTGGGGGTSDHKASEGASQALREKPNRKASRSRVPA